MVYAIYKTLAQCLFLDHLFAELREVIELQLYPAQPAVLAAAPLLAIVIPFHRPYLRDANIYIFG